MLMAQLWVVVTALIVGQSGSGQAAIAMQVGPQLLGRALNTVQWC